MLIDDRFLKQVIVTANKLLRRTYVWDEYSYVASSLYGQIDGDVSMLEFLLTEGSFPFTSRSLVILLGGFDINAVSTAHDCTALHHFVEKGNFAAVKLLVEKYGALVVAKHVYNGR